jgi:GcrA cell cycle regulator
VGLAKRPWTQEDNARLKGFVAQGASIIRAAAALHRNIKSVRIQARKLGEPFPPMRVFRKKLADVPSSSWRQH